VWKPTSFPGRTASRRASAERTRGRPSSQGCAVTKRRNAVCMRMCMHVAKPARHPARATKPAAALLPEQQQAGRATLLPTCQPTLPTEHLDSESPSSPKTSIDIVPDSTRRRPRRRPRPTNQTQSLQPPLPPIHPRLNQSTHIHHPLPIPRRQEHHPAYRASNCIRLDPILQYQIPNTNAITTNQTFNPTNGIPLFTSDIIHPSTHTHTLDALNSSVQYTANITHTTPTSYYGVLITARRNAAAASCMGQQTGSPIPPRSLQQYQPAALRLQQLRL
jgi:hypothetical protein